MKIYFDHNATTVIRPEALALMLNIIQSPLNASAVHNSGQKARRYIECSRKQILNLIAADSSLYKVIFTASGTEANNIIINSHLDYDIFISATEHPALLNQALYYPNIKVIDVDSNGLVNLNNLEEALHVSNNPKKLISVMLANNETGVIATNMSGIVSLAKKCNAIIHSDIIQAAGKIKIDIEALGLDAVTLSGHKFGGPMGAGALVIKNNIILKPFVIGGGQEGGIRSGSQNVAAIAGFGIAAEMAANELSQYYNHCSRLQQLLEINISSIDSIDVVAKDSERLPNTSLLAIKDCDIQTLIMSLDLQNIEISAGSACSSSSIKASHVLKAMGYPQEFGLRVSSSRYNNRVEINKFMEILQSNLSSTKAA